MADLTPEQVEEQRQEILKAMLDMASVPPAPGEVKVGDVVHAGNSELDVQMMVSSVKGAGVMYIYDTRTGEQSRTNKNMLPTQLSKKREDGSQVFTIHKPPFEPKRGQFKCMLHPDLRAEHPDYEMWGLPTCTKDNLASRQDVKSHMQSRHKRQWQTIEEDRLEREKEQEQVARRAHEEKLVAALVMRAEAEVEANRAPEPAGRKRAG